MESDARVTGVARQSGTEAGLAPPKSGRPCRLKGVVARRRTGGAARLYREAIAELTTLGPSAAWRGSFSGGWQRLRGLYVKLALDVDGGIESCQRAAGARQRGRRSLSQFPRCRELRVSYMPLLRTAGRSWRVASDDFVLSGVLSPLFQLPWLVLLVFVAWNAHPSASCPIALPLRVLSVGYAGAALAASVLNLWLARESAVGSIFEESRRWRVPRILHFIALVRVFEACWTIVIPAVYAADIIGSGACSLWGAVTDRIVLHVLIIVRASTLLLSFCGVLAVSGRRQPCSNEGYTAFCRRICCCARHHGDNEDVFHSPNEVFEAIGRLLHRAFGLVDLAPSDLFAGLVLVRSRQKAAATSPRDDAPHSAVADDEPKGGAGRRPRGASSEALLFTRSRRRSPEDAGGVPFSPDSAADRLTLAEATRSMRFAFGIYGWPTIVFANPSCGCCRLAHLRCRGVPCGPSPLPSVRGDSCFACNQTALMRATGVEEAGLLFASLASRVALPAYAIVADHACQTVNVVVRGTLSLEDCVTDALAESASLDDVAAALGEGGDGWAAHAGMVAAARNLLRDIRERGVLDRVLPHRRRSGSGVESSAGPSAPLDEALMPQLDRLTPLPGYRLRVCGHSLGAGTASLLALLLRAEYPALSCYAFGAPGGLVAPPLAAYMESFVTTVVLGKDLVCRLSFPSLDRLRSEVVEALCTTSLPKWRLLARSLASVVRGQPVQTIVESSSQEPQSAEAAQALADYREREEELMREHPLETLSLPGRILHIQPDVEVLRPDSCCCGPCCLVACRCCCSMRRGDGHRIVGEGASVCERCAWHQCGDREFRATWRSPDAFRRILVSTVMTVDHMPDHYLASLEAVAEQLHPALQGKSANHVSLRSRAASTVYAAHPASHRGDDLARAMAADREDQV